MGRVLVRKGKGRCGQRQIGGRQGKGLAFLRSAGEQQQAAARGQLQRQAGPLGGALGRAGAGLAVPQIVPAKRSIHRQGQPGLDGGVALVDKQPAGALPPMQPGSSIMPGKVNPVIPEVVNQICYRIIGNDLTVTFAAEAGQLQLNVMEPVMVHAIFSSIKMLQKGMDRLRILCVEGITANTQHCREMVLNSIGIVTALNPTLGYENSSRIAKRALKENRSVYDLVLEEGLLTKDELDQLLKPESMIKPHKFYKKK